MLFSYNWLKEYIKGALPDAKKLADILTMHCFEVEEVKKTRDDYLLNVDILPNRAHDSLCYIGLAREVGAVLGKKVTSYKSLKKEKLTPQKGSLKKLSVKIQKPKLVPRFSALVIEGVKIKKSPPWLRNKLEVLGINSINNVVDLTNYVMLETGQPLHAFDYNKIRNQKFLIREAVKGEEIITLDGVRRELGKGMLIAEDKEKIFDLAGIMGGKLSEVDSGTKNIVLQAANFDRKSIYLAAKEIKYSTVASDIYSQGIDSNLTALALERALYLLKEVAGSPKVVEWIDIYPKKELPRRIKLDLGYLNRLLGGRISKGTVSKILKSLEMKILSSPRKSTQDYFLIEVPTFRQDIVIPEDLIEEIGRIFGLERIKPTFPVLPLKSPEKNFSVFWQRKARDVLRELGFTEVYNYSFFGEKEKDSFGYQNKEVVEIENPVSVQHQYLRTSLIPNLMKNIQRNQNILLSVSPGDSRFKEIRVFELGKIFFKNGFKEKNMLTGAIVVKEDKKTSEEGFYRVKGLVDTFFERLGISEVWYDDFQASPEESKSIVWHPARSAEIKIGQDEVGFLGEINPTLCAKLKISDTVLVFDFNFDKIQRRATEEKEYQPVSIYPSSIRDLAVLVPEDVKVVEVLNVINSTGTKLIRDVDLFDVYSGKELRGGMKSLAFHIIYQAEDRTLTAKEVDEVHKGIIEILEKNPEWEVRR